MRGRPRVAERLRALPQLVDFSSDQQDQGRQSLVVIDRATAARLGVTPQLIDDTLYDAFGQRQVSTMYTPLNQYHVVMEAAPRVRPAAADAARDLRASARRHPVPLERAHPLRADVDRAGGQPPGAVSRR